MSLTSYVQDYMDYRCVCDKPGRCRIGDEKYNVLTCGVIGLLNIENARVINGKITCEACGKLIYECTR